MKLTDRFEILGRLGEGGMGGVYIALDGERNERVALKTLRRSSPQGLLRFKREFRELAELVHPNLVALHELVATEESWFYTMELVDGLDFLSYLGLAGDVDERVVAKWSPTADDVDTADLGAEVEFPSFSGPRVLNVDRVRDALRQLVTGIDAIHRAGRIHGDIKPGNVRVTASGRVVLLDFGLVHGADDGFGNADRFGTPLYAAPEVLAGEPTSTASDWYAVGMMLYQALTGRSPFIDRVGSMREAKQARDLLRPRELCPEVPSDLDQLCVDLLHADPTRRPSGERLLRSLSGEEPSEATVELPSAPAPDVFVGRVDELERLHWIFETHRKERAPVAVLIQGPSGIGKSALVERFLFELVEGERPLVLRGRCFVRESIPFNAFDRVLDGLGRFLSGLPPDQRAGLALEGTKHLIQLFPALGEAIPEVDPGPSDTGGDALAARLRAFRALKQLLGRLAENRGVVIHLDDVQWSDRDSGALLGALLSPPSKPPVLLVVTYRSEEAASSPILSQLRRVDTLGSTAIDVHEVALGPLGSSDVRQMALAALGGSRPQAEKIADRVVAESGGHPMFAQALLQSVAAGEQVGTAPTLDSVVSDRMRGLPEATRRFVETVAVAGYPIALRVVDDAVGGLSGSELALLQSNRWMRFWGLRSDDRATIYHDRIREAVVTLLSNASIASLHRRLAEVLDASENDDPDALVIHYRGAGLTDKAALHAQAAAVRAEGASAFDRAARMYELALESTSLAPEERLELQIKLGDALANAHQSAEAADGYLQAAESAEAVDRADLRQRAASLLHHSHSGRSDEAAALVREACKAIGLRLPRTASGSLVRLALARARQYLRGRRFEKRAEHQLPASLLKAIDVSWALTISLLLSDTLKSCIHGHVLHAHTLRLALRAGEPARLARSLFYEAHWMAVRGDSAQRAEIRRLADDLLTDDVDDPYLRACAELFCGLSHMFTGDVKEGFLTAVRSERLFRQHCVGVPFEMSLCRKAIGLCLFASGDVVEISRQIPEYLAEAEARGNRIEMTQYLRCDCLRHLASDDVASARRAVRQVSDRLPGEEDARHSVVSQSTEVLLGLIDLYEGSPRACLDRIGRLKTYCRGYSLAGAPYMRNEPLAVLGRLAIQAADAGGSRVVRLARRVAKLLRRVDAPISRPAADLLEAASVHIRGEHGSSIALLERAIDGSTTPAWSSAPPRVDAHSGSSRVERRAGAPSTTPKRS